MIPPALRASLPSPPRRASAMQCTLDFGSRVKVPAGPRSDGPPVSRAAGPVKPVCWGAGYFACSGRRRAADTTPGSSSAPSGSRAVTSNVSISSVVLHTVSGLQGQEGTRHGAYPPGSCRKRAGGVCSCARVGQGVRSHSSRSTGPKSLKPKLCVARERSSSW